MLEEKLAVPSGGQSRLGNGLPGSDLAATEFHCELMSEAVSDRLSVEKIGCRVAAALEESFIAAGWPSGTFFGTEEELCQRYGVSRRIYREAVRVLTMRGTAQLRRGSSPGLMIAAPDLEVLTDMLRGYAFLVGVTEDHRNQAVDFIEKVRSRISASAGERTGHLVLDFFSHFICAQLDPGMPPKGIVKDKFRKTRAGQIALRILEEYALTVFTPGVRVGSEQQLSEQYRADRSITRQAIRLLESSGVISSVPGRGKGLFTMLPPSGPLCRSLCCYFAAHKLSVPSAFRLFETMDVEITARSAQTADTGDIEALQKVVDGWSADKPWRLGDMIAFEDGLLAGLKNPLIDLMFRSVRGYVAPTIAREDEAVPDEVAACFMDYTRRHLAALKAKDLTAAVEAQQHKIARIRELEQRYHPHLSQQLQHESAA